MGVSAGLLYKEWMQSRWTAVSFFVVNIIIGVFSYAPLFSNPRLNTVLEIKDMAGMWFAIHMFLIAFLLITSVNQELIHLDLWLHTENSLLRLVGMKAVLAIMVTFGSLILCAVMSGLVYYTGSLSGSTITIGTALYIAAGVIVTLMINGVFIMAVSFFVWSFYQMIKSTMGSRLVAYILTAILAFGGMILWGAIYFSEPFTRLREAWPIMSTKFGINNLTFMEYRHFILTALMPESAFVTGGGLLLYGFFTLLLFMAAVFLLGRKVRNGR
ncbi:hypothetical protein [Sporosarcina sp. Te-1]|uniref:hypothetical protein n=1 Tax=Sporosarcina sp. Te-1 TaxID=2818390 RepID=UPI001A9D3A99|nr:hypothetical protein [Sporosarcina sp. Te-1]QTD39976.1 hypothetical protein J3U78_14210 [Sporosarcina sp. Te-1]